MTSYPTPRDLPQLRHDLAAWYGTAGAPALLSGLAECGRDEAAVIARRQKATLDAAGLYFVNEDMTDLAVTIGEGLDTYAVLAEQDLPEDHGLLMWSRRFIEPEDDGLWLAPIAVTWSAVGDRINIALYDHLPSLPNRAQAQSDLRRMQEAGTPAAEAPALVPLWETRMRADGRDRPWVATEDNDPVSHRTLRTLLATWLLLRQPTDTRKSLHSVEEVPASKAAQKQIRRAGGDPTQTARYITLRKALRPTESDDAGAQHAGKIYRHRWFVRPHRRTYPDQEHPAGKSRKWVGPYLVVPRGCEDAPILNPENLVNVLRR